MNVEMRMPDLATTGSAIRVLRWMVLVDQPVRRGQALLEIETDKAVMEVESVVTGVLKAVAVNPGEEVVAGQVIATFLAEDGRSLPARHESVVAVAEDGSEPERTVSPRPLATSEKSLSFFARNRQARARPADGVPGPGAFPARRTIPLGAVELSVARRTQESKQTIPHFYLQSSANAEPMVARRMAAPEQNVVWDAFFVHAVGRALLKFERMCYRFEGDRLVFQEVDAVGIAVDRDSDLFTIAIESPAAKSPEAISQEIREVVTRLRQGDSRMRVSRRANLTVSNLGGSNVESFAAVINPPEAAILAVGKVMPAVVAIEGRAAVQNRVTLTLSVDHRVVNGKYAADFLSEIIHELESL